MKYLGKISDNKDLVTKEYTDAAAAARQPKITSLTLPLPASGWTQVSGTDNYTQPVTISGVTANTRVDLQPDETVLTQLAEDGVIGLFVVNTNGTLTAKAVGAAPTAALSVQASLTEVSA